MPSDNRPLSPHLQIYRLPFIAVLSISHRMAGVANSIGSLLVIYWLVSLASGPDAFERAQAVLGSWLGLIILFLFSLGLFYHLCNGIRHLFWDAGKGFELETAKRSGQAVIACAVGLTVLVWIVAFATGGA
ncbi:succinate dehydrogenase, cytochrome b556 subunit [Aquisalimonas asiatica]|uniref:Succinate dehydrogenase cytochrome b556 subunit n=1 Tax=Aquisalimonas asiatica TaxID=406100 RepID=A0A1H8QBP0_9GAMM|nr:succinate dehydrogenase, cytochrome b556 subunit [Aquisalimonas asiatica]SEO51639.1 succinate dehydrogenase subunit C [Aquisalimonas asiatica]